MKRPLVVPRPRADPRATLFRALADPVRLAVLERLARRDETAGALARSVGVSPSRLSNHLARLRADGLVEDEARGRERLYRLRHPETGRFLRRADALAALADAAATRARRGR